MYVWSKKSDQNLTLVAEQAKQKMKVSPCEAKYSLQYTKIKILTPPLFLYPLISWLSQFYRNGIKSKKSFLMFIT